MTFLSDTASRRNSHRTSASAEPAVIDYIPDSLAVRAVQRWTRKPLPTCRVIADLAGIGSKER